MQRRRFLEAGAALAALATPKWIMGQACQATQTDRYGYGPYYLEGAPDGALQIGRAAEPGEKLSITGIVSNCTRPLQGVKLELWHATRSGCYIHPAMNCDDTPGTDARARLWGALTTNAYGGFAFNTIKPGRYLNGARYRPSHIHFRITTPGRNASQGGIDLVTQLYFEGDEYIRGDYAADHASAAGRIIPLIRNGDEPWRGTWNVNLPSVTAGLGRRDPLDDPAMAGFDLAIQRRGSRILFQLPPLTAGEPVEMRIFAPDGSLVRRSLHRLVPIEVDAGRLNPGLFLAEFRWWTAHGLRKERAPFRI